MSPEQSTDGGGSNTRYKAHGFYSSWEERDLDDMHECTVFITDEKLVIGDMGEYEVAGGIPDMLPDPVEGLARKFLADDDPDTLSFDTAQRRRDTDEIELTNITEIETEQELPSRKQLVEIEQQHGIELSIFIGTGSSYGGKEETQEFVSKLEAAARDAGGAPRVTSDIDF